MSKKTEMIGFKTTREIKEQLTEIAKKEDRTLSYIINRIITDYLSTDRASGAENTKDEQSE